MEKKVRQEKHVKANGMSTCINPGVFPSVLAQQEKRPQKKRILVLDQSKPIQTLLSTYFKNSGHQVITCGTTQEALNVLLTLDDAPDMIFLAFNHEREAYKVITYVREHGAYAHTHVVAMIPQERQADIRHTLSWSKVSYLIKPFHIREALALLPEHQTSFGADSDPRNEKKHRREDGCLSTRQ